MSGTLLITSSCDAVFVSFFLLYSLQTFYCFALCCVYCDASPDPQQQCMYNELKAAVNDKCG